MMSAACARITSGSSATTMSSTDFTGGRPSACAPRVLLRQPRLVLRGALLLALLQIERQRLFLARGIELRGSPAATDSRRYA